MAEGKNTEKSGEDRRAHPRHFMHLFITVIGRRGEQQVEAHGVTVNVSLGGVLALLDNEVPVGEDAVCEVRFQNAAGIVSPEVCRGAPLRGEQREPDYELAIEFDELLDSLEPPD